MRPAAASVTIDALRPNRPGRLPPIFFHPDYDRRPWPRTRSADPARNVQALAGSTHRTETYDAAYRRWGLSPRPEDV